MLHQQTQGSTHLPNSTPSLRQASSLHPGQTSRTCCLILHTHYAMTLGLVLLNIQMLASKVGLGIERLTVNFRSGLVIHASTRGEQRGPKNGMA